jgi:hypothetical protein
MNMLPTLQGDDFEVSYFLFEKYSHTNLNIPNLKHKNQVTPPPPYGINLPHWPCAYVANIKHASMRI